MTVWADRLGPGIRGGTVEAGRLLSRAAGMATASLRAGPDFLVIGAKRGGTTSAYFSLLEHPQVLPLFPSGRLPLKRTHTKGVRYFDLGYEHSLRWYLSHFPSRRLRARAGATLGAPVVAGEASPYYLFHPLAAGRAASVLPDVKVIAFLRDPVERTYSHYREQVRNGVETLEFEAALDAEAERTAGEDDRLRREPFARSFAHESQSYRAQSEYARSLRRWLRHYPREQVLVLPSESLYTDPQGAYDDLTRFLDLSPQLLAGKYHLNAAPTPPLAASLRRRLRRHFAADVAELERLLGQSMPWARAD